METILQGGNTILVSHEPMLKVFKIGSTTIIEPIDTLILALIRLCQHWAPFSKWALRKNHHHIHQPKFRLSHHEVHMDLAVALLGLMPSS